MKIKCSERALNALSYFKVINEPIHSSFSVKIAARQLPMLRALCKVIHKWTITFTISFHPKWILHAATELSMLWAFSRVVNDKCNMNLRRENTLWSELEQGDSWENLSFVHPLLLDHSILLIQIKIAWFTFAWSWREEKGRGGKAFENAIM